MHNMLGFVISLFLVFQDQHGLRSLVGRPKQWGPANNVRNLALKLSAILRDPSDHVVLSRLDPRLTPMPLAAHLQKEETVSQPGGC